MHDTRPIRENKQFKRIYSRGRTAVTPALVAYCVKNRGKERNLGITVGKKVGNAVHRNRARRVIREAYRLLEPEVKYGYDMVLVSRVRTYYMKTPQVYAAMRKAFYKLGLIERP